jgi:uncharacterized protein (TIGR02996 family)
VSAAATADPALSGLLRAVLGEPGDDALRLIYADRCDELGDAARAEFVRVQCELARVVAQQDEFSKADVSHFDYTRAVVDRRQEALRRRERELLDGADEGDELPRRVRWLPFPEPSYTLEGEFRPRFRRGFVESLTLPSAAWLRHADGLTAAVPITSVALTDWPRVKGFGNWPRDGLYSYTFAGTCYTPEWFRVAPADGRRPVYRDRLVTPAPRESLARYVARELLAGQWPRITFTLPR